MSWPRTLPLPAGAQEQIAAIDRSIEDADLTIDWGLRHGEDVAELQAHRRKLTHYRWELATNTAALRRFVEVAS